MTKNFCFVLVLWSSFLSRYTMCDIELLFWWYCLLFSLDKTMDDVELLFCFGVMVFFSL